MQKSPIQLDESTTGIVIVCSEHPYWSAFRFHLEDGRTCAIRHETMYHPNDHRQRDAAAHRARHAERRALLATTG